MLPFGRVLGSNNPAPIAYRSSGTTGGTVKPAGIAVGDLVIIVFPGAASSSVTTSGGSLWASGTFSGTTHYYSWKILNATDVANTWTISGAGTGTSYAWEGRGATTVTKKAGLIGPAASTLTLTGFTPDPTFRGQVSVLLSNSSSPPGNPAAPTTFTKRDGPTASLGYYATMADSLGYAGGNIVWTNLDAGFVPAGAVFEIT